MRVEDRDEGVTLFQFVGLTVLAYLAGCLCLGGLIYATGG